MKEIVKPDKSIAKFKADNVDNIIIELLKKHTQLGYMELERQVQDEEKKQGQKKPSSHMTIYNHLKGLQERGQVGHNEAPKGYVSPYHLIQYDEHLEKAAENFRQYLQYTEEMFALVKGNYEKFSYDEKSKSLLCVITAIAFLRLQIGLARQYTENLSFLKAEEERLVEISKDINRFATKQRDPDLILMMDGMLDTEVKRMFYLLGEIIEPKLSSSSRKE
jgi:hypothetical protein